MKCKYCGGEIRLEDMQCPFCGRPNEEAIRHAQDMQRYQREFQQTKADVTEKASHSSRKAVRIAAIAFLLAAIVGNIVLQMNSYSFRYAAERRAAKRNAPQFIAAIDTYLEEEDYIGFVSYCQNHNLSMSDPAFDKYYRIYRTAHSYKGSVQQMMKLINHSRYTDVESIKKWTAEDIQEFYENLDPEKYSYYEEADSEWSVTHIENMKTSLEALYVAYLDMTPEEAAGMESLSRGKRAVLIENGMEQYTEVEDDE